MDKTENLTILLICVQKPFKNIIMKRTVCFYKFSREIKVCRVYCFVWYTFLTNRSFPPSWSTSCLTRSLRKKKVVSIDFYFFFVKRSVRIRNCFIYIQKSTKPEATHSTFISISRT